MEASKSWSQFGGLPGAISPLGKQASYKPHRREVQEASGDSVWLDGRQPVLPPSSYDWITSLTGSPGSGIRFTCSALANARLRTVGENRLGFRNPQQTPYSKRLSAALSLILETIPSSSPLRSKSLASFAKLIILSNPIVRLLAIDVSCYV
jgi:hypothetical protein